MWKTRLAMAIDSGKSEFTVDGVRKDNACDFGRWLYGPTLSDAMKRMPDYETCRHLHADFHAATADVLKLALAGRKTEAVNAMGGSGKFAALSGSLTSAMMKWMAAAEKSGV